MTELHILNGPDRGESFVLDKDILYVGRSPKNDIHINDIMVSRRHLKLYRKGEKFFIEDLKSTNGTFVEGEQLRPQVPFQVEEGVPITIGISILCIGEKCPEKGLAFLDSVRRSEELGERDTAFAEEKRRRPEKNIELFYKVSNLLMLSSDVDEISEKMLDSIFGLLKRIDRGAIILVDAKTGGIERVIPRLREPSDATFMMYSRSVVDRVIREGKAVIMPDTRAEERGDRSVSMELMKVRSVMSVPLISRSQIRGVIYLDSVRSPYGFRNEDLSLVTALSIPAALAIEQALLQSEQKGKR